MNKINFNCDLIVYAMIFSYTHEVINKIVF